MQWSRIVSGPACIWLSRRNGICGTASSTAAKAPDTGPAPEGLTEAATGFVQETLLAIIRTGYAAGRFIKRQVIIADAAHGVIALVPEHSIGGTQFSQTLDQPGQTRGQTKAGGTETGYVLHLPACFPICRRVMTGFVAGA